MSDTVSERFAIKRHVLRYTYLLRWPMKMRSERGFTLVELLTIVAIIGVLANLSVNSFIVYRSKAAYSNCQKTVRDVRMSAELGTSDPDNPPGAVALYTQNTPGPITGVAASNYLRGMAVPKNMKVRVSYDPTCVVGGCVSSWAELKHCQGTEYIQWIRFGDGTDQLIENIAGTGC